MFLSSNIDRIGTFAASVPGLSSSFNFSFSQTYTTAASPLSTVNIADAVGTYAPNISTYQMGVLLANGTGATFNPATVTIQAIPVPEPATYGLMGLGLAALAGLARRRRAGV